MVWPAVQVVSSQVQKANGERVSAAGRGLLMGKVVDEQGQPCGWLVALGKSIVTVPLGAVLVEGEQLRWEL